MRAKRDVFSFNHIDTSIDEATLLTIKTFYRYYHRRWWCYRKTYRKRKRTNLLCKLGSSSLIAAGTISGGITMNPVVLGVIASAGLLLKTYTEIKSFERKIEMCKYAYTTYEKVLSDLRSCLRGKPFDKEVFISEVKLIDETVTDLCPSLESCIEKQYEVRFLLCKAEKSHRLCPR